MSKVLTNRMQGKLNVMLLWSLKHVRNVIGSFVYSCFNL